MAAINIGSENASDVFYRYKMPRLQARIEGRGNGIKTNVVNNVDIAKALERPPDYIVKYYGCELGAQTKFDKKTGLSIVNGAHDTAKLVELLEGFIKKYVQCYSCGNPETVVRLKKDLVSLKCKACGAVSEVDARHKLNTYIINHPPEEVLSKAEKKLKKLEAERMAEAGGGEDGGGGAGGSKKEKKEKKEKKKKDKEGKDKKSKRGKSTDVEGGGTSRASPSGGGDDDDDDDSGASGGEGSGDDDDDVVWQTDTSAAAAAARAREQLSDAMAAMVTLSDEVKGADARAEAVAAVRAAAGGGGGPPAAVIDAAAAAAAAAGTDTPADRAALLVEALLLGGAPDARLAATAAAVAPVLAAAAPDAAGQMALAVGVERALALAAPDRVSEAGLVFKALYDADVLDEAIIMGWAGAPGAGAVVGVPAEMGAAVRAAAAPFVAWLEAASSEDEDEDDSDE